VKILVADDDLFSRKILENLLTGWSYQVTVASTGDEALSALRGPDAPRLAILDWVMPGPDGSQICRALRGRKEGRYTYILLVTAMSKKEDIIRGLEAGADDYLAKPYDPLELKARLIAGRRILDLQEELIAAREAMRYQATRDFLTGAWNHRAIMEILERELARTHREGTSLGVILGDLDHFKKINDTHGHRAGDAVLRETARRMEVGMRPYDYLGRYGGEEFLVVVPGGDHESTARLAERLRQRLASEPIFHEDQSIRVTGSFGVAVRTGQEAVRLHTLLDEADKALYRAKRQGRNRVDCTPTVPA
jgi:diguanylate cyclase (GGDEF)-like protein